MKSFITKITQLAFIASLLFTAVGVSAASFDPNPAQSVGFSGVMSIGECNGDNCANRTTTLSYDEISSGEEFTVFLNYKNNSAGTITSARGNLSYDRSGTRNSTTITGTLSGAGSRSGNVSITNLPESWEMEFVGGEVYVDDRLNTERPITCSEAFPRLNIPRRRSISSASNINIGPLTYGDHKGYCEQGYVEATFVITDTTVPDVIVPDVPDAPDVEVRTSNVSDVFADSAQLNGEIESGDNAEAWFVLSTSSSVRCTSGASRYDVSGSYDTNDNFDTTVDGLRENTRYYYRACADQDGATSEGRLEDFRTEEDERVEYTYDWYEGGFGECQNRTQTQTVECREFPGERSVGFSNCSGAAPVDSRACGATEEEVLTVQTLDATGETQNRATLNGIVTEGTTRNTYFVYGTNSSQVQCSNASAPRIISIDWQDEFSRGDEYSASLGGLSSDRTYYYRACATTAGFNSVLAEGRLESFQTLGNTNSGSGNTPIATTEDERDVERTSAQLNGNIDMNGVNDGDVFFVWGTDQSDINDVDVENRFSDVRVDGDRIQKREVRDNFDGERDFDLVVSSLQEDETYYYRMCVEYEDDSNRDQIECGITERFDTDGSGSTGNANIDTDGPDMRTNSVTLNGRISNVDDDYVAYFALSESSGVSCQDSFFPAAEVNRSQDFELELDRDIFEDDTYYYRACALNSNGDVISGSRESFTIQTEQEVTRNVVIRTESPQSVTRTTAEMCGDLTEDAGSSQQTWFELRPASGGAFTRSSTSQRREGSFCERVSRLSENTSYLYRACTNNGCAPTRSFRTLGPVVETGIAPIISTLAPTNIAANSARLNGYYLSTSSSGRCWFNYGRDQSLGKRSSGIYNTVAGAGSCTHNFTGLASGTQYCVQAVVETQFGTDTGSIQCFTTPRGAVVNRNPVIRVVEEEDDEVDLLDLGLGLSLIRLEIDNDEDVVTRGDNVEYVIEWENISELDLEDLKLEVTIPSEVEITDSSRGDIDNQKNKVYFTIDELEGADFEDERPGESGRMVVTGVVGQGTVRNTLSAVANIAYDNPINDAQENAQDFDWDEYGLQVGGVTASIFGLTNITFLGWLVIILGLFIIFLIARWLYLEREEMRAQAYIGGGYPYGGGAPRYDNGGYNIPPAGGYQNPAPRYDAPPAPLAAPDASYNDSYEPYRPNRG